MQNACAINAKQWLHIDQQKKEEASLLGRVVCAVHATSGSEKIWGDSGKLPEILENLQASFIAHMWP